MAADTVFQAHMYAKLFWVCDDAVEQHKLEYVSGETRNAALTI
jgi:hypothetical protein